ncbi:MAG: MerR family transcriptional regulator [Candidatus Binatia bacterium]
MDDVARFTIDELAAATGVSSRTIRFYQARGVLPRPVRHGRLALYDAGHVERLRLVGELHDRGLSLRVIRSLVRHGHEDARSLGGWLDDRERLGMPWTDDRPRLLSEAELAEVVGERPAGTIAALVRAGVVEREPAGAGPAYRIPSPGVLRIVLALEASGIAVATAVGAGEILRGRLREAARELVAYLATRVGRGFARGGTPDEIGTALEGLRPLAGDTARLLFTREVERALRAPRARRRP